ncbi:helix-turn-helix transcriptional regulator [Variovorax paradoxus]|uniref:AlpA family phage regulatory protein n=1 Tax=Variovorax paradoxus TaxID=34073 RepID=A0A6I6HJE9_VARPD|nr:AlpA family phage regulatory protein [Variovorax paradoxus]QGW82962.1 AlpA family phage regulatory protein [Variovorax paradoxus]
MKLLRIPEVCQRVRRGKSTIYSEVKKGTFPAPMKQGSGNYWLESEIDAYLQKLISERPANPPTPAS